MSGFESNWSPATPAVRVSYGPQDVNEVGGGQASSSGKVKELVYRFSYDDLPTPNAGTGLEVQLPIGAQVLWASVKATTTFVGGTSYDIGLQESDATEVDNDGIFDALTLAQLNAGTTMSKHAGTNTGALEGVETTVVSEVVVVATGTFTSGEAELVVQYIQ